MSPAERFPLRMAKGDGPIHAAQDVSVGPQQFVLSRCGRLRGDPARLNSAARGAPVTCELCLLALKLDADREIK